MHTLLWPLFIQTPPDCLRNTLFLNHLKLRAAKEDCSVILEANLNRLLGAKNVAVVSKEETKVQMTFRGGAQVQ